MSCEAVEHSQYVHVLFPVLFLGTMAQQMNYGSLTVAPCDSPVLASWIHIPGYHQASAQCVLGYGESL